MVGARANGAFALPAIMWLVRIVPYAAALQARFTPSSLSRPTTLVRSATVAGGDPRAQDTELKTGEEELGAWIPVGSISALSGLGPTKLKLMGLDLVLWESPSPPEEERPHTKPSFLGRFFVRREKQSNTKWSVLADVCPHRLAPLSLGRVEPTTGCLECPYHGWQFDTDGCLTRIPQLEANSSLTETMIKKGSTQAFPVHTTGDLLWAFLPTAVHGESFPKSLLPEDYYYSLKNDVEVGAKYHVQEMPASMDFMVENSLDPAHFACAHHGVISDRSEAGPVPITMNPVNFTHVSFVTSYTRKGSYRERTWGFQRPNLLYSMERNLASGDWERGLVVFFVPVEEGRSRIITSLGKSKLSSLPLPDWVLHLMTRKLVEGDYLMHEAELKARRDPSNNDKLGYFLPTTSDKGSVAFRSWYNKYGFSEAPPHSFAPASVENLRLMSRQEQMNPWRVHTQTCSSCRGALAGAKRVQRASWVTGVGSVLFSMVAKRSATLCAIVVLSSFLSNRLAQKLVVALEGSSRPSATQERNIDE